MAPEISHPILLSVYPSGPKNDLSCFFNMGIIMTFLLASSERVIFTSSVVSCSGHHQILACVPSKLWLHPQLITLALSLIACQHGGSLNLGLVLYWITELLNNCTSWGWNVFKWNKENKLLFGWSGYNLKTTCDKCLKKCCSV